MSPYRKRLHKHLLHHVGCVRTTIVLETDTIMTTPLAATHATRVDRTTEQLPHPKEQHRPTNVPSVVMHPRSAAPIYRMTTFRQCTTPILTTSKAIKTRNTERHALLSTV